jgi:hypothetical protein
MVVLENVKHPTANSKYAEEQNTKEPPNRNLDSLRLKSAPVFILCEMLVVCYVSRY